MEHHQDPPGENLDEFAKENTSGVIRSKRITVDKPTYAKLNLIASDKGLSIGEVVEKILDSYEQYEAIKASLGEDFLKFVIRNVDSENKESVKQLIKSFKVFELYEEIDTLHQCIKECQRKLFEKETK